MRGLLVPVFGDPFEIEFDGLEGMQRAVGGYIEAVPWLFDDNPSVYVNEEGKLDGALPNRAIVMGGEVVDILFGPILCTGFDFETGDTVDIADDEIDRASRYFTAESPAGSGMDAAVEIMMRRGASDI